MALANRCIRLAARRLAFAALLAASCSETARRNPLPSMRLGPSQIAAEGALDAGALVDRDTSRGVALVGSTRVALRFDHAVEIRRVKIHAAAGVMLSAAGATATAGSGWTSLDLPNPVAANELALVIAPGQGASSVAEIEAWGAGLPRAPRDPLALARATASPEAAFEDARVLRAPAEALALAPPGGASGDSCASATFPAAQPRQARRAYLVYEAELPRAVSLQRSVNGEAPQGGFWVGGASASTTLVDELDPETLQPENGVLLCLPIEASGPVTVRGLRLVLVLDSGDSPADRETVARAGAVVDGDGSTSVAVAPGPLDVGLDRPIQVERAELRVPEETRVEAVDFFDGHAWASAGAVSLDASHAALPLEGFVVQALRLAFAPGARPELPAATVSEIALAGSGVGPRIGAPRIVVTYPPLRHVAGREIGERFADRAYVAGWAESPSGRGAVEVNGVRVDVAGAFAVPLERAAGTAGPWSVVLRASFPDGREATRTIHLDDDRGASAEGGDGPLSTSLDQLYGREGLEARGVVDRANGGKVTLGSEVSVEVPPDAVRDPTSLGIARKGHESMPRLDAGMVNVTAPPHFAYRFLPKGQRFAKPVKVTLPFDPSLLPEGVGMDEIKTYWFDEGQDRWIALPRVELLASARRVVSETTHFTFMINAVLVLPDHPGPVSFDPNSIKDLEVAEPSAGMDLVEAPEANAMGTAQLALPIRLPPARGAHQPVLKLSYDSSAGNGWAGVGWDLAVPSVQIDTRFGVHDVSRTEPRYLLDGAQIVPTGEHARCEGTSALGDLYRERIAREFGRIVRCGTWERDYWFEVSDRDGTLRVYGHGEGRLRSPNADQAIGQWFLERAVDTNGNLVEYHYDEDFPSQADRTIHREPFRQVYLRSIRYTGLAARVGAGAVSGGMPGPYVVDVLHRAPDGPPATRFDAFTSARLGFKVLTRRLLGTIRVSRRTSPIREYELVYEIGALGKSRLAKVRTHGFQGSTRLPAFHEHGFEYEHPDARNGAFGTAPVRWSFGGGDDDNPNQLGGDLNQLVASEERARSKQGGLSLSIPGVFSIGGNRGKASSSTETKAMLADVNGDGLPDRLTYDGWVTNVAFNRGLTQGGGAFTTLLPPGDPASGTDPNPLPFGLSAEHGTTDTTKYRASIGPVGASIGESSFTSTQTAALMDYDGDGFLDWTDGYSIVLARSRDETSSGFEFYPWPGPQPERPSWVSEFLANLLADGRRPSDVVLEWIAQYPGEVDVTGWLSIRDNRRPQPDPDWDGVRLRVYRAEEAGGEYATEQLAEIATDVSQIGTPVPLALEAVPVDPGTRLYFVLSTLSDFPVYFAYRSPVEEAEFAPLVAYRNVPAEDRDRVEPNGARAFVFDSSSDFRLAGGGPQAIVVPAAGHVRIQTTVVKRPSTDDVRCCIQLFPESAESLDEPCRGTGFTPVGGVREYGAAVDRTDPFDAETDVVVRERLVFRVESDLSIDPADVEWRIAGRMTEVLDELRVSRPVHPTMADRASFVADAYVPLHVSIDAAPPAAGRWSATPDPVPLLPLVVPEDGALRIVTRQQALPAPATTVWIAARTSDALVFKQSAADPPRTITIPVTAGQEIFFEAHSEVGQDLAWAPAVTLVPAGGGRERVLENGTEVPLNRTRDVVVDASGVRHRILSQFAGGYHGWRYGAWHGENDAAFDPNAIIVLWPYVQSELWSALATALEDPMSPESLALAAASPLFPRRLGTYAGTSSSGLRPNTPAFVSKERTTFVTADTMHASRECVVGEGSAGMELFRSGGPGSIRLSTGYNDLSGIDLYGIVGINKIFGSSEQNVDPIDMDGDGLLDAMIRLPPLRMPLVPPFESSTWLVLLGLNDVTARLPVQFTDVHLLRTNADRGGTANVGASIPFAKLPADGGAIQAVVGQPTVSFGLALGVNMSSANNELADVNGDGLPDAVRYSQSCPAGGPCFLARLNMGAGRFGAEDVIPVAPWRANVDWLFDVIGQPTGDDPWPYGPNRVRRTTAVTLKTSAGVSFLVGHSRSWESSIAQTQVMLVDVTGDGLPDYVRKGAADRDSTGNHVHVMVNTGSGFLAEDTWHLPDWPAGVTKPFISGRGLFGEGGRLLFQAATAGMEDIDAVETTGSFTPDASVGFSVSPVIPVGPVFLGVSYGEERSTRVTGLQLGMMDMDGDGLLDHVLKAEDRDDGTTNAYVYARLNRLGKANLLKRVSRPLGGKIDLFYGRAGNTVAMPESRWVLEKVIVRDGRGSDVRTQVVAGHDIPTSYLYENGRRDRYERELLGFGRVTRTDADGSRLVREYRTDRFAFKGLLARERTEDSAQRVLVETVNEYRDPYAEPDFRLSVGTAECEAQRPFNLAAGSWFCGSLFPALHATRTRFHEREPSPRIETSVVFSYDVEAGRTPAGGVPRGNVVLVDDLGDAGAANAADDLHAAIAYFPDLASGVNSVSRPRSIVVTDSAGATLRHREGEYDARGNLSRLVSWIDGSRTADTLLRWNELGLLDRVQGPLVNGRRYTLDYGYDFVVHTYRRTVTDSFGYTSTAEWDYDFGAITDTTDVNGQKTQRVYDRLGRLKDLYGPHDPDKAAIHVEYAPAAAVPYARTRHRLPEGGFLDTVLFQDGLGRAIQTRKTAEVHGRGVGWSVSGHVRYDAMGRVAVQGQAFFEPGPGFAYAKGTPLHPKSFLYDPLGRIVWTQETIERTAGHMEGKAETAIAYGFGTAGTPVLRRAATVTDPEGKVRVVFRDPADRVVGVEERDEGVPAVTRYVYDPVGQLRRVLDAGGHETVLGYDLLGRRISIDNPDTGAVGFLYDAAGNLVERTDAKGQTTKYQYVFHQLRKIDYPDAADVTYEYGPPGAPENGAGRVVRVVDDAGSETRGYGRLGELVRTTRTVRPFRPGDTEKVFETKFAFDVFGRMQWVVYPDGERVTYGYDAGGLLESATGLRPPDERGAVEEEKYVESLTYDELGQRKRLVLGNGAVTTYSYYPESRRLRGLGTTVSGRTLQALAYLYDRVGNVLEMVNALPAATGRRSGPTRLVFGYDDLYRLTSATGRAESRPGVVDSFSAGYAYDAIHNMTRNTQEHVVRTLGPPGEGIGHPPETNHDFGYVYSASKPHQATQIGETHLVYDGNGNVDRECRDNPGCAGNADHLRRFYWTEENRLAAVVDGNGESVTRFVYDAAGERVAKLGRGGESLTVGQFFSLKGRKAAAKHVFAGPSRIATKISPPPGWQPASPEVIVAAAGEPPSGSTQPGCQPSGYSPQKCDSYPGGDPIVVGPPDAKIRPATYYYHPDHLGSTSWVSDQNGRVHEHVEYFPYGQVWRDARADSDARDDGRQRYLFTGKELDEETGLYYFGARYYDPVRARWASADPALADFIDQGNRREGPLRQHIFVPANMSLYSYGNHSPAVLRDADGQVAPLLLAGAVVLLLTIEHDEPGGSATAVTGAAALGCGAVPMCAAFAGGVFVGAGAAGLQSSVEAYGTGDWRRGDQLAEQAAVDFASGGLFFLGAKTPTQSAAPAAAGGARSAYEIAKTGGRHAGLLKNYVGRSAAEIQKGLTSLERQAALHGEKVANPAQFAERWGQMSAQEQAGLLRYWQKEAARYQEQAEVLRGLLGGP